MGGRDTPHSTQLQGLVARVHAVSSESPAVADVVLLQEALEQVDYDLDSAQQLLGGDFYWGIDEKVMKNLSKMGLKALKEGLKRQGKRRFSLGFQGFYYV